MRIALLCSGLGNVHRGHEVFARDLFSLIGDSVDMTLFKGGGEHSAREWVIDNIPRNSSYLNHIHVAVSPKWVTSVQEQERTRIETETFAYASLKPLLEGKFDVIHCLEQEVCNVIHSKRHLFERVPKLLFSNGGAIPAPKLPYCDFVQEHTDYNLGFSAKNKSFMIPHGVDLSVFNPQVRSDFREQHGIPADAFVAISVGTIGYWHKRMDYVIREVSRLQDVYLIIAGQECADTPEIKELGKQLMGNRVIFVTLPHAELPKAYAAANVFVLGSLFEAFGIVYIEAMAMGLPVICTEHPNQRSIVKKGVFIKMDKSGSLTESLRSENRRALLDVARQGYEVALECYDLNLLKQRYIEKYTQISATEVRLPSYSLKNKLVSNVRNTIDRAIQAFYGKAN